MTALQDNEFGMAYGGVMSSTSRLRIAIPTFGLGRKARGGQMAPRRALSRDELLVLFKGELGHTHEERLTEGEVREREMAWAIRRALYPVGERSL
jgi:hypothetical protein